MEDQLTGYVRNLRVLLKGCERQIFTMFVMSLFSVALDLFCLALLPVFVLLAMGGAVEFSIPLISSFFGSFSLLNFAVCIVCLFLFRAAYMLLMGAAMAALSESVRKKVVMRLFESVLWRPYEAAIAQSASAGITVITGYSNNFTQSVVLPLLRMLVDLMTIVGVLGFVALIEPVIVLVTGVVLALVASAYYLGIRRINDRQSHRLADLQIELTQQAAKALGAPREIRVFGVQDYIERQSEKVLSVLGVARAWLGAIYIFPRALGELTLIALAIVYMVANSYAGTDFVSMASNLSVIAFAGLRLLPAFAQSMTNVSLIRAGRTISSRLADMIEQGDRANMRSTGPLSADGLVEPPPFESLEIEDLSFIYSGSTKPVFTSLSLTIRAGESIGIVGASGAGKSTLGDLLLGLLQPSGGEVLVNGKPALLRTSAWWQVVGFVPQSPYIVNESVLNNVAFGRSPEEIDEAKVRHCLEAACLAAFIDELPQGAHTVIGDAGVRLSGGQRQRVAIARTLYWERDLLILDEATSALDAQTEAEVISAIEALKGKVTTVIIAHRLSTLGNCDRVYEVLEGGVREIGTGEEVLRRSIRAD